MHKDKKLYEYMLDKTWQLTEQWYQSLDKSQSTGVYASTDPDVIQTLKQQNHEFHKRFCKVFQQENIQFQKEFGEWVVEIAKDDEHLGTPIHFILKEFFRTQEQYLDLIQEFVNLHREEYSKEVIQSWTRIVTKTFSEVMTWFTEEYHDHLQLKLQAQQEMINELSSPVILLNEQNGLLPLVGDIDTTRAKFILEYTLMQCVKKRITHLFIDLSGVIIIDTMVAHQIFQLIDALKLVGVTVTLSGIRSEIAQTAVQLGLSFGEIQTTATLAQAIALKEGK
ncbi:STAS domain-containing protein [Metabacillus iocasae]|uniref:RsbT co-antagonist protein RsbR n=1 Tax=Priestia iocasae TaxID=2291674 RepID=A0ABS2QU01_9BACI|nr:STAS domain-containing protein [Metabacillus iocasae]MBM7702890.1 rsbT co-antagonist protein RsbR [Metabacillus iocasae]